MHCLKYGKIIITLLVVTTSLGIDSTSLIEIDFGQKIIPPTPKFQGTFAETHEHETIANRIKSWRKTDKQNIWELSGLYEGDIMTTEEDEIKNGLIKTAFRWPGGVVPYYIKEEDFDEEDIEVIKNAIEDYHQNTCIRFRPYEKSDIDYITIEAKSSGCWSLVGRHDRGQVVNLQNPGCVQHGVIVHELMHALGFYHQQSAADRDEWVAINWENIKPGREHNFNKYDNRTVTDYGIGYDYDSIMHYSSYAFSKNGEPTITPKKKNVKLGQRKELSEKDTLKLREMYKEECGKREMNGTAGNNSMDDISIEWILSKKL
ncbi:zinc metalloproteinase nas-13 isoform X1 [Apis mellifera caucasica]|uniref:Metalloendopeptidase n=2 Tax=Apis mellifera TaxID=7460 RepID=A0A7M7R4P1_APIME|nr:zinc metalloproteinase nas-13 isoform X1 [Apis mellifera]KAG6801778.1 zinc metalloproteinase nas-13 isoform X1 [Apis mellifera caucasica]KAG9428799.1 zinc metalloproteinase nas-13 isoform X1 [Apis mellifera carnica]|eukprot:XP_393886.3 zinc metalloproteinase nas-13 isoform X1 [Apis mellifera]